MYLSVGRIPAELYCFKMHMVRTKAGVNGCAPPLQLCSEVVLELTGILEEQQARIDAALTEARSALQAGECSGAVNSHRSPPGAVRASSVPHPMPQSMGSCGDMDVEPRIRRGTVGSSSGHIPPFMGRTSSAYSGWSQSISGWSQKSLTGGGLVSGGASGASPGGAESERAAAAAAQQYDADAQDRSALPF